MNRNFGSFFAKPALLASLSAVVLAVAVAGTALPVRADDDAHEFREKTMKAMAGSMKVFMGYLKGSETDAGDIAKAAAALAAASSVDANKVFFPKDAKPGEDDSKVKPALWAEWPKAEGYWKDVGAASAKLTMAVASNDKAAIGAAVKAVGQTCSTCHEAYRIKKD